MRRRAVWLLTVMTVVLVMVGSPAWATTFTVNSTADTGDAIPDGACDTCTLREALQEATANNNAPTVDLIQFAIPGAGPHTISPVTELPDIDEAVTIDGYTEALGESTPASPNTLAVGTNAVLKIVLSGANGNPDASNGVDGFDVEAGPTTIRGLVYGAQQPPELPRYHVRDCHRDHDDGHGDAEQQAQEDLHRAALLEPFRHG
jgi:CSLREA domain-containing protein